MNASEYQELSARTLVDDYEDLCRDDKRLVMTALGLAGEAGEVVDCIKKTVFHGHPLNLEKISKEIGDVMWYVAAMCTVLELDLSLILLENVEKLEKRYPSGFSVEDSLRRLDVMLYNGKEGSNG